MDSAAVESFPPFSIPFPNVEAKPAGGARRRGLGRRACYGA